MKQVTDSSFETDVLNAEGPVLVDVRVEPGYATDMGSNIARRG